MLVLDLSQLQAHLQTVSPELRTWLATNRDEEFSDSEILQALCCWLEAAVEELALEAFYHCAEGSSPFAVGRNHFKQALEQIYESRRLSPGDREPANHPAAN